MKNISYTKKTGAAAGNGEYNVEFTINGVKGNPAKHIYEEFFVKDEDGPAGFTGFKEKGKNKNHARLNFRAVGLF